MFNFTSVVGFSKQNLCECVCVFIQRKREIYHGDLAHMRLSSPVICKLETQEI